MSSVYTNEARRWVVVVVGSGEKVDIGEEREDVITLMDNEQDAPHKYEDQPKYSLTSFSQVLFAIHF